VARRLENALTYVVIIALAAEVLDYESQDHEAGLILHRRGDATRPPHTSRVSQSIAPPPLRGAASIVTCAEPELVESVADRAEIVTVAGVGTAVATVYKPDVEMVPRVELPPVTPLTCQVTAVFFNLSWGPVMWVMLGEMFPNQIRGSGLAVSGAAQWTANFLISMSFAWLAKFIGLPITYGVYTACAFLSIFFVLKRVHETRGRELEDMVG
jgi:hypothetical protein